jgi:DNA-binding SARP family transcriptional activator/predicted negative regulator of RcsB-dependent stress response
MVGERDILTATQAHHNLGICYIMQGQSAEGIWELELASRLAQENSDEINVAYIANDIGSAETMRGQLAKARQHYHQALAYWRKIGNASASAVTLQNLGVVHHYLGQYAEAESYLQEGLAKAREAADVRIQAHALASQGDLYRDTARYDEALTAYQQAMEIVSEAQLARLAIYLLDAIGNTYRLKGDLDQARQSLSGALAQVRGNEMDYELGLCQLSLGVLALRQGQPEEAQGCLAQAQTLFVQGGAKRDLGRTLLHLAALARLQGGDAEACASLTKVARLAAELGSHQFIISEGPSSVALMRYAEEQGIRGLDYTRIRAELAQVVPSASSAKATNESQGGTPLEFLGLNGGQVLKEGQVVTDWESASARFMAFFFVSRSEGLRRDQVIDALWPEVTQAKGNSLFHSTVYRLRRALFKNILVHEHGVYCVNPECTYRYDVAEFRRLAKVGRGTDDAAHVAREQALELYRSPFLQACEDNWCHEVRQSLQEEMLTTVLLQAQCLAKKGSWSEAESLYMRALSVDSYDERAHRGVMCCRAESNDRTGAIRQFRECARILRTELDVEPGAETYELYEAIVSGAPAPMPS